MPIFAKLVLLGLFLFVMYWITEFAFWGWARWQEAFIVPGLLLMLLYGAWHDGYLSRGGLKRFIREQLPLKLQNFLLKVGLVSRNNP